ncbi:MAG: hypothetical protein MUE85_14190 [Microscillaceae bacterium]|jgi:hypothetical protein|nr:hypothetical protein [Microscillaceae bacterium]
MSFIFEIEDPQFLIEFEKLLAKYQVQFANEASQREVVSEKKRQERAKILQKFKGGLEKYADSYTPTKNDWYEQ